jgi:hypothetical protein
MRILSCRAILVWVSLALSPFAATADPVDIRAVRQVLESAGVDDIQAGIVSGTPLLSGEMQKLGFVTGLSRCQTDDFGVHICEEVAFKACLQLAASNVRGDLLEIANTYNLRRYAGSMVISSDDIAGEIVCTLLRIDVSDDNSFGLDETYRWAQALTDFKSFLVDSDVTLRDPSKLY